MITESLALYVIVLLATGIIVGFACGLLGVGGGFIMVPVQIWALTSMGIDPTLATRIAFGTSLAVILPTSLSGCHGHSCRGVVLWRPGITMGLAGLAGAFLGGTIAAHAPG
ncbi:MAG TPA: sulfite exporter TauE/SafE family protein, partial [Methanothrix sp.]